MLALLVIVLTGAALIAAAAVLKVPAGVIAKLQCPVQTRKLKLNSLNLQVLVQLIKDRPQKLKNPA